MTQPHEPEDDGHGHEHDHEHHDDGYTGPATILVDGQVFDLGVILAGYVQPLDGRYHWYGRIAAEPALTALAAARPQPATIVTPHGRASGRISDPDLWGRVRIEGSSTPPFAAMLTPAELD